MWGWNAPNDYPFQHLITHVRLPLPESDWLSRSFGSLAIILWTRKTFANQHVNVWPSFKICLLLTTHSDFNSHTWVSAFYCFLLYLCEWMAKILQLSPKTHTQTVVLLIFSFFVIIRKAWKDTFFMLLILPKWTI